MPLVLAGTNIAKKNFEELLSATWAAQLMQARTPDSCDPQVDPDSEKTSRKEGDVR